MSSGVEAENLFHGDLEIATVIADVAGLRMLNLLHGVGGTASRSVG